MKRSRPQIIILIVIIILCGLLSRGDLPLPSFFQEFAGDVLWAAMIYFLLAFVFLRKPIAPLVVWALLFSYGIEFSQLLQWDWLVYLRTTAARYLLGQGFVWTDLLCYTVGVLVAAALDVKLFGKEINEHE